MKRYRLFLFLLLSSCMSCTQFDEEVMPNENEPVTTRASVNAAALRASAATANADNPYSVDNMEAAMIQYCKFANISPRPISATHEYVRFEVRDSLDYYILDDSLGLELFTYPLDRMLSSSERDFYSNDIIDGKQWYYTVVPKNYRYPAEVERQVLQDIYMQGDVIISGPHATSGTSSSGSIDESLYDTLLELSMKNAGISVGSGPSATAKWVPSARILYTDDLTDETVPLKNVTVRVNTFVNIGTGRTNENGEVEIPKGWGGKFRNPVDYEVKFKNDRFKLLEHHTGVAIAYGPTKSKNKWTCTITSDDKRTSAFAAVYRAAYHFFYEQTVLTKPLQDKFRIAVFWDQNRGTAGLFVPAIDIFGSFANPIRISGVGNSGYYSRSFIQGTTFHELGHASHWARSGTQYIFYKLDMMESYATAVEYYFQSQMYPNEPTESYRPSYYDEYNGIGEALLNNGFSMAKLQEVVVDDYSRTWSKFNANVKATGLIPDWLVDYLFLTANYGFDFDILTESIATANDEYVVYKDVPVTLKLQKTFRDEANAKIQSWTVTPSSSEAISETETSATFQFNKEGTYTVTAEIKLPEVEDTYTTSREITVVYPSIVGPNTPRLGVSYEYQLTDNRTFQAWDLEYLDKDGNWVDGKPNVFRTIASDPTMLCLIFHTFGTYRIVAHFNIDGEQKTATKEITVPAEGRPTSEYQAPGIYLVRAYGSKINGAIVHQMTNRIFTRVLPDYVALSDSYNFRTFSHAVTQDHPYADDMKAIYRVTYNGSDAYSPIPGSLLVDNTISGRPNYVTNLPSVLAFYVLSEQQPGTIPIYSVKVTENISGVNRSYHYVSRSQLNRTDSSGNTTRTYKTVEILGYVYPVV